MQEVEIYQADTYIPFGVLCYKIASLSTSLAVETAFCVAPDRG